MYLMEQSVNVSAVGAYSRGHSQRVGDPKGLFTSQSPSALTGSKSLDLASEVVNAFLTTPFSNLFY
ncbi:hypothetical protein C364_06598 [Cryptococcus neoformans Bt63]|nr:hypothetical protein C364_06598 [Cryptococcus neoformans var. grubii Bt63]